MRDDPARQRPSGAVARRACSPRRISMPPVSSARRRRRGRSAGIGGARRRSCLVPRGGRPMRGIRLSRSSGSRASRWPRCSECGPHQARIEDDIFAVHAASLPRRRRASDTEARRLHDGQAVLCYPIAEVVDIVRLPDAVRPATAPGWSPGSCWSMTSRRTDRLRLMEQYAARHGADGGSRAALPPGRRRGWLGRALRRAA